VAPPPPLPPPLQVCSCLGGVASAAHFAFSFWCHDPAEWEYTYGTASPHPPEHGSEDYCPSWAAHPSKFCGSHDVDDVVAFKVLHRGEWVYPDDVDLD
jgi:hypothetical protein